MLVGLWGAAWIAVSAPVSAAWNPKDAAVGAFNAGVDALNSGDLDAAWGAFSKAKRKDPACGRCDLALAEIELRRNDPAAALDRLAAMRATYPHQPVLLATLSQARFVADDYSGSHEAALDAAELDPSSIDAWQWAFRASLRLGVDRDTQLALGRLRKLLSPGETACYEMELLLERGQTGEVAARLPACAAADPGHGAALEVQLQSQLGDSEGLMEALAASESPARVAELEVARLLSSGDAAGAAARGMRALAAHSDDWMLLLRTADALAEAGQDEAALELLDGLFAARLDVEATRQGGIVGVITHSGALKAQAAVADALMFYVAMRAQRGDVARARAACERAEAGWPGGGLADGGAAVLVALTGDGAAAWARLEAGLTAAPESRGLLAAAGWMLQHDPTAVRPGVLAALRQPAGAHVSTQAAARVQERAPATCVALLRDREPPPAMAEGWGALLASCASAAGDDALAAEARAALAEGGADVALATFNAAVGLYRREAWAEALSTLEELRTTDPEVARAARSLRVGALTHLGRLEAARDALADGPVDAAERYNLAVAWMRAERVAEAAPLLEGLASNDPALDRQIASLHVDALARTGDIDGALTLLQAREVAPLSRANLAVLLYNAQRLDEAHALTRAACPELEGEARAFCDELHQAIEAAR